MVSVVLVMMIIAEFVLCCDYGAAGVGCIVMMYLLSSNREVAFAVAVILLGLFSGTIEFLHFLCLYRFAITMEKRHFTKICLLRLLPGASFCTVSDMQACYGCCCSHLTELQTYAAPNVCIWRMYTNLEPKTTPTN